MACMFLVRESQIQSLKMHLGKHFNARCWTLVTTFLRMHVNAGSEMVLIIRPWFYSTAVVSLYRNCVSITETQSNREMSICRAVKEVPDQREGPLN